MWLLILLLGERRCSQCGAGRCERRIAEITDLEATERQLRRWHERGELKARVAQRLLSRVQTYRRQLLHADGTAVPKLAAPLQKPAGEKAPAATILAKQRQNTTTLVVAEVANHGVDKSPVKPFGDLVAAMAPRISAPSAASPPSITPAIAPATPSPAAPKPPPSPRPARLSPPEPRRTFAEMLATFMDERNIRWGELVGGLLIVCSSIALVISLRDTLNTIPYFQFLILVGVSAAVFGAGLYTEHRWILESTSRGILIIATLLVPLNFVAMAATAKAGWDWFALLAELISLGLFVALVERAARVLV